MLVAITRLNERQELIAVFLSKAPNTKITQQLILPRFFEITSDSRVTKEQSAIRFIGVQLRLCDCSGD
jgi:hypothetical protein